jgi:hypothetical protein
MSYQHKMTQWALRAYRGPLTLFCGAEGCEGRRTEITKVELECGAVRPFRIDAVLTTTEGEVAVEVTYRHATEPDKWARLEAAYGVGSTVDIDVSQVSESDIEEDGSFYLPHAPGTGQLVTVDEQGRHPEINLKSFDSLVLRTRERSCQGCAARREVRRALDCLLSEVDRTAGEAAAARSNEAEHGVRFAPCGDCGTLLELYRHEYCSASRRQRRRVLMQGDSSKRLLCKACSLSREEYEVRKRKEQEWAAARAATEALVHKATWKKKRKCCTCERWVLKAQAYEWQHPPDEDGWEKSWVCKRCVQRCPACGAAASREQLAKWRRCYDCNSSGTYCRDDNVIVF